MDSCSFISQVTQLVQFLQVDQGIQELPEGRSGFQLVDIPDIPFRYFTLADSPPVLGILGHPSTQSHQQDPESQRSHDPCTLNSSGREQTTDFAS